MIAGQRIKYMVDGFLMQLTAVQQSLDTLFQVVSGIILRIFAQFLRDPFVQQLINILIVVVKCIVINATFLTSADTVILSNGILSSMVSKERDMASLVSFFTLRPPMIVSIEKL